MKLFMRGQVKQACLAKYGGMEEVPLQREFFIANLLVRVHFIVVMIRWTGLAPPASEAGVSHQVRRHGGGTPALLGRSLKLSPSCLYPLL